MSINMPTDLETTVITLLKDNTNGVQAKLTAIDTTRSTTTPAIVDEMIVTERTDNNPELVVDFEVAEMGSYFGDSDFSNFRMNADITTTVFLTTGNWANHKKFMSNYFEAMLKCLHGYSSGAITIIYSAEGIIGDLYKDEIEATKFASIRFNVLINGGV